MDKQEEIIQKLLRGELDQENIDILINDLSDDEIRNRLEKAIEIDYLLSLKYLNVDSNSAYADFLSKTGIIKSNNNFQLKERKWVFYKYAALFLGLIGLGYLLVLQNNFIDSEELLNIENAPITIQLDNGQVKVINESGVTDVFSQTGQKVATQNQDKITYGNHSDLKELVYNQLNIPYGKKFQIELSDGTLVYLNSGSSLKYPVKFLKGQERKVFIEGEAYFDVIEDAEHPFIVNANQVDVRVLGTEFNVSAYKEDQSINTVLVSGRVELYNTSTEKGASDAFDILPEQMGVWDKDQKEFKAVKVNVAEHTAWMSGRLVFRDTPFKTIREKLERHYNVTIINNDSALDLSTFNAVFDIENIEEVMETFNRNFGIKYKIEENKIIIQPKTDSL